jgi:hypothetical protein
MKTCEGCGAPRRLDLTACDYCRRDYERVYDPAPAGYLAALQAQQSCNQYSLQAQMAQNQLGAAMGSYYNAQNAFNSQWWGS